MEDIQACSRSTWPLDPCVELYNQPTIMTTREDLLATVETILSDTSKARQNIHPADMSI